MLAIRRRPCQVCGGPEAKNHYGGIVCSPCRIFFIRCIKLKIPNPCLKGNNCKINSKSRNICNNCRYRRCNSVMNAELVGLRRNGIEKSVVPLLLQEHLQYCMKFYHLNLYRKEPEIVPGSIETIYHFHKLSLNEEGPSPSTGRADINVSLDEVLLDPELCSSRLTAGFENRCKPSIPGIKYSIPAAFCRGILACVDFLRLTQYFNQLSDDDKKSLLRFNLFDFVMLILLEFKLQTKVHPREWITIAQRYNISSDVLPQITKATFLWMEQVQELFEQGRVPDEIEFTFMKVIAVYTCPMNCSQSGRQLINAVKESYIKKLCKYLSDAYCHLSKAEQFQRLSTLLEIIRGVKETSRLYQLFFTEMSVTSTRGMRGRLTLDVTLLE